MSPTAFEKHINLPVIVVDKTSITLSFSTRDQLHRPRVKYKQKFINFNHDEVTIPNQFITSTKSSFESLMMHNGVGSKFPKLTAGIKQPDEYYLDMTQKNAFIIEKKTQKVLGSVDEKIQTAAFKQWILRKKFNTDWNVFYMFCLSNWFKEGYEAELEYFDTIGVPCFWGEDKNYHTNVLSFIKDKIHGNKNT